MPGVTEDQSPLTGAANEEATAPSSKFHEEEHTEVKDNGAVKEPEAAPADCGCGAKEPDLNVTDTVLSPDALQQSADMSVFDADGNTHTFKSIIEGDGTKEKHLIIFIRHFYCGVRYPITYLSRNMI